MHFYPICLASSSLSRKEILEGVKFDFISQAAEIDETIHNETVEDYVSRLSKEKAFAVLNSNKAKLIVAADSVAEIDGEILGKPKSKEEAILILSRLAGNWHTFITGLCLIRVEDKKTIQRIVKTRVKLAALSDDEIQVYVDKILPFRYAGGFSNSESSWFIEEIEGSISNLMGLPMSEFYSSAKQLGFSLTEFYAK